MHGAGGEQQLVANRLEPVDGEIRDKAIIALDALAGFRPHTQPVIDYPVLCKSADIDAPIDLVHAMDIRM